MPGQVVGEEAAEERSDQEGDAEDGTEETLVLAALGRGEQVADDGQGDREEGAGAEALDVRGTRSAPTSSG